MIGSLLALLALILEIIHWAITKDLSLPFIALVLVTLAIVLGGWGAFAAVLPRRA